MRCKTCGRENCWSSIKEAHEPGKQASATTISVTVEGSEQVAALMDALHKAGFTGAMRGQCGAVPAPPPVSATETVRPHPLDGWTEIRTSYYEELLQAIQPVSALREMVRKLIARWQEGADQARNKIVDITLTGCARELAAILETPDA